MALTDEEKRKIEEEEGYRAELKKQLGDETEPKREERKGMGCLVWCIIIFVSLIALGGIISSSSSGNKTSTSPLSDTDSSQRELVGDIEFTGTQFIISNLEKTDWKLCSFEVNEKYRYPTKTSDWAEGQKIDEIKAGETITVGFSNFTLKDGTRFNAFQTKPQSFYASCSNGIGYWGW